MGRTASLIDGLRTLLLGSGITPVTIGALPDTPDAAVGLNPYPLSDDLDVGVTLEAVQVVIRGTQTGGTQPILNLRDQILDVIGRLRMATVGTIPVSIAWRQMSAPIAPDARGRPEARDTYYLRTDRLGIAG